MNQKEFKQYIKTMVNSMLEKVPSYSEEELAEYFSEGFSDDYSEDFPEDFDQDIPDDMIEELANDLAQVEETFGFGKDWGNTADWGNLIDWAGMNEDLDGYGSSGVCDFKDPCHKPHHKPHLKPHHKHHCHDDKLLKCFIFTCLKLKLILCLLKNNKFCLREIKKEIALLEKAIFSPTFGLKEIKREIRRIECGIFSPTFGLPEIKREVRNIELGVFSPTFGLPEIKSEVSLIETIVAGIADEIDSPTFGLVEIKSEVSEILAIVSNLNVVVPTLLLVDIKSEVSAIESAVFSETFGLAEIKSEISEILAIVTNLDFTLFSDIKSEVSTIESAVFSETFGLEEIKSEVSEIFGAVFSPTFGLEEIKSEVSTLLFEFEQFASAQGFSTNLTTGPFLASATEDNAEVKAFNATATFQSVTFEVFDIGTCPISLVNSVAFLDITPCCGASAFFAINPLLTETNLILNAQTSSTFGIFLYAATRALLVKQTEFFSADFLPLGTICV